MTVRTVSCRWSACGRDRRPRQRPPAVNAWICGRCRRHSSWIVGTTLFGVAKTLYRRSDAAETAAAGYPSVQPLRVTSCLSANSASPTAGAATFMLQPLSQRPSCRSDHAFSSANSLAPAYQMFDDSLASYKSTGWREINLQTFEIGILLRFACDFFYRKKLHSVTGTAKMYKNAV